MYEKVYSEFECDKMGFKVGSEGKHKIVECIGSTEEALDTKTVTKKCRGIVKKSKTKGTGTGTLKVSAHMPYDLYASFVGMDDDKGLKDGITSYGQLSLHKEVSITQHVLDEDDVEKFKAYPRTKLESFVSRKIENGGEEVAELEMEFSILPDERGQGMYEAVADGMEETAKTKWMEEFSLELVKAGEI